MLQNTIETGLHFRHHNQLVGQRKAKTESLRPNIPKSLFSTKHFNDLITTLFAYTSGRIEVHMQIGCQQGKA